MQAAQEARKQILVVGDEGLIARRHSASLGRWLLRAGDRELG